MSVQTIQGYKQSLKKSIALGLFDSATDFVLKILMYFRADTSNNPNADMDGSHAVQEVFDILITGLGNGHRIHVNNFYIF